MSQGLKCWKKNNKIYIEIYKGQVYKLIKAEKT